MHAQPIEGYESLPRAGSYRLLNFEWAEVVTLESFSPQFILRVGGTKHYANMSVDLSKLVGLARLRAPGPPVLHVRGDCEFPTAGFSVELRRREPQGFNQRDLLLDRIVRKPSGPVAQVITVLEARYREETDFEFDTVTILPDGVSLQVQEVS